MSNVYRNAAASVAAFMTTQSKVESNEYSLFGIKQDQMQFLHGYEGGLVDSRHPEFHRIDPSKLKTPPLSMQDKYLRILNTSLGLTL
jgi:hypothetical protein